MAGNETQKPQSTFIAAKRMHKSNTQTELHSGRALSDIDITRLIDLPWLNLLYDDVNAIVRAIHG
jgi:hypothetical protein